MLPPFLDSIFHHLSAFSHPAQNHSLTEEALRPSSYVLETCNAAAYIIKHRFFSLLFTHLADKIPHNKKRYTLQTDILANP